MKKIFSLLFLLFYLSACDNSDRKPAPAENDVDAARSFIQAALSGDYKLARNYMLDDSVNQERMTLIERVNLSEEERKGLAAASIRILNVNRPVKDSVTIVVYSNSYKNNPDTLKVLKQNGEWLVDFNYLFDHDNDSLVMPKTDSLPK